MLRKPSRSLISLRIARAISFWVGVSFSASVENQARAWRTRAAGGLADMLAGDLDRERLGAEAGAVADLAGRGALIFGELLAHPGAFGLEHAAVEIADHAVERLPHLVALAAVDEAQGHRAALGAVEDDVVDLLGQVLPRRLEAEAELARRGCRAPACNKGEGGLERAQGTTAPFLIESASLGTISSGSNNCFSPRPSQPGQAPCGALKLNRRGSISAMVKPETGQANFSEKVMRPSGALSARTSPLPSRGEGWERGAK